MTSHTHALLSQSVLSPTTKNKLSMRPASVKNNNSPSRKQKGTTTGKSSTKNTVSTSVLETVRRSTANAAGPAAGGAGTERLSIENSDISIF